MAPPSFDELSAQANAPLSQQAKSSVGGLAPFATTYTTGNDMGMFASQLIHTPSGSQSTVGGFLSKMASFGGEAAHLVSGAVKWAGNELYTAGDSIIHLPTDVYHFGVDAYDTHAQNNQVNELIQKQSDLSNSWRSGFISTKQYQTELKSIMQDQSKLSSDIKVTSDRLAHDGGALENSIANTTAAVLTVMTGGLTAPLEGLGIKGAAEASDYLTSTSARAFLAPVENTISKAAVDKSLFETLTPSVQNAIKDSIYRVVVNSPDTLSAAQMSKAAAVNFALKYPLGYAAISSTGKQIYTDLQNKKYGAAVGNLAFNAVLLFSGGPIGLAMEKGSEALKGVSVAMGLRPGSTLDTLSTYIADGDGRGLAKIAQQKITEGKIDEVKAMIVAMDSNLARAGGNSNVAVQNIVDHLENYVGWGSLTKLSHQDAWDNLVNYWKHAEGLNSLKKAGKIEGVLPSDNRMIVPGRFSTADKNNIADLSDAQGQGFWESYKQQFPNSAGANNVNLDKQMTNISQIADSVERRKAIMSISTQIGLEGVPEDYAKQMAKDGYMAIIPKSHNVPVVPFEEGSKTLATQGAEGEFFTRARGPVPVMQSIGTLLTRAGLSPEMSAQRTYQTFNDAFVKNADPKFLEDFGKKLDVAKGAKTAKVETPTGGLSKDEQAMVDRLGITPDVMQKGNIVGGESTTATPAMAQLEAEAAKSEVRTPQQTADYMMKKARQFMANPTRGGVQLGSSNVRLPLTDIRQLTTNDIKYIYGFNDKEAQQFKEAVLQAHLDMPRQVVGAGERLMDYNYKYNPLAAPYARTQGAFRFTFNPFFRNLRLPFKAEFLSQAKANGKFLTVPGTNWLGKALFAGRYKEFDGIIAALKKGELLPGGLGGEAADISGTADLVKMGENYPKAALYPVASLVSDMARRSGLDTATFISRFPQEVSDAATSILHYDKNNSFLNSPLMKTLNFAFFPARFNTKVATILAKNLAQQDPLIQFAVVKGLMNADTFFTSPQGQAWYAQNADIIGLFKYISPVATLSEVAQVLGSHGTSIGAYGELGGLPFGWIPQMLASQGIIQNQTPYVNPTTGTIAKDYIPANAKGRIEASIEDLISSIFSYPGATMGLPSKTTISRNVAEGLTGGTSKAKNDFTSTTPTLSPQLQQFQTIVQQLHGGSPEGIPNNNPAPQPTSYQMPSMGDLTPPARSVKSSSSPTYDSSLKRNKASTAFAGQAPLP